MNTEAEMNRERDWRINECTVLGITENQLDKFLETASETAMMTGGRVGYEELRYFILRPPKPVDAIRFELRL